MPRAPSSSALSAADALRSILEERQIRDVKIGIYDIDGVMAGKYMSTAKFLSALKGGFGFCDVLFGWDVANKLYDNTRLTGWQRGYADAEVRLLPESWRELPFEANTLLVQGEIVGRLEGLCPRGVLRRVLDRAADMGFSAFAGFEYEFLVLEDSIQMLQEKGFRHMRPMGTGGFGYSVLRNSVNTEFYEGLMALCHTMDMPVEGLHEETGPGALEAALHVNPALKASDDAALFKTFVKVLAQRQKRTACFMAKWDESQSGQGGHIHVSLQDKAGRNVFHDAAQPQGISALQRHFVAGLLHHMPAITALAAPTINSYRRLVPGYWAPTTALWGVDNRTVSVRAIPGSSTSQRVEYRLPGADCNPYLALASCLAAGLDGIAQRMTPPEPVTTNGYLLDVPPEQHLPRTLWDAAQALKASPAMADWLGADFVEHFALTREWEARQFQASVTDWELNRYFEII
ncbi:glutamine synthetase family protein [Amphibiibacter pelophylacis]|uniref:Glutamine synthetase n=1 Tax=Amphibiibacter pelophylacis TaxID=1799477 RepID=A0ACC6P425_9BURK